MVCFQCAALVAEDEVVWIDPDSGRTTVEFGEPHHVACAPDEPETCCDCGAPKSIAPCDGCGAAVCRRCRHITMDGLHSDWWCSSCSQGRVSGGRTG